ncbi:MAG: RNA-binding S4 domain-containing protein [Hyphomonadaceae bacterium]|nr:RNA-binding S4 domain-containing protein [Hyphomonadaceae bacterium]
MTGERLRLDVWLWRARFFKTRSLATAAVERGVFVERNGQSRKVDKASASVEPGDGVSFRQGKTLRTVRVLAHGERRGPAAEARGLYEDLGEDLAAEGEGA